MAQRINNFDEFWLLYVREHADLFTRRGVSSSFQLHYCSRLIRHFEKVMVSYR
jgi:hypothetical protein